MLSKHQRTNNLFFVLYSYIRDKVIRKHENCITKMQMKKATLFIKRIELNLDMSEQYRRKNFQNLKRSKSQITINKSIARASSRRFNSIERERDYTFHTSRLSEKNREFQISMRSSKTEQSTQKWCTFVENASFSHYNKTRNIDICYNCDKKNYIQFEYMFALNIVARMMKKNRDMWTLSSFYKFILKKMTR